MFVCKSVKKLVNHNVEFLTNPLSTCKYSTVANPNVSEANLPPKQARVVICGGGAMGASVAYHLAKRGWGADTLLIEQHK